MFVWRNGTSQLHFCSQWDQGLGSVRDRDENIRRVSRQQKMIVKPLDGSGAQVVDAHQKAVAVFRGLPGAEVLELHVLVSNNPSDLTQEITRLEQAIQSSIDLITDPESLPRRILAETPFENVSPSNGHAVDSQSLSKLTPTVEQPLEKEFNANRGLVDFFSAINGSLNKKQTALNLANELRRQTESDRVSLLTFRTAKRCKLEATSGVSKINRKGRETMQLEKLVAQACKLNQVFHYPVQEQEIPSDFHDLIEQYLLNSSARSFTVVPIHMERRSQPASFESDTAARKTSSGRQRMIAAIVLENFQTADVAPATRRHYESLSDCAGDAYRNAFVHQRTFLYPVWSFLGQQYDFFVGKHFSRTTLALILMAVLIGCAVFFQGDYRLSCEGQLLPTDRRTIWAEIDGVVSNVGVETAQRVAAGTTLLTLENKDLVVRQQEYSGNLFSLRQRLGAVERLLAANTVETDENAVDSQDMSIERASLVEQVKTLEQQLSLIDEQLRRRQVTSPIAGIVMTSDLQKELRDRPVSKGTSLLEVADVNGGWVLELKLPDRKTGEMLKANHEIGKPLHVSFIRSSEPSTTYIGQVLECDLALRSDDELGQYLRMVVSIDHTEIVDKKIGMEVVAYLHCGKKSYAYIWTKDIVDFVYKNVIFPLF